MRGSSDVLGLEMQAASQKGQGLQTLGALLNTAGGITGMGAGAGWWGAAPSQAGNIGTIASQTLKPGMTLQNVVPLTGQNYMTGGVVPFGTQLTGGIANPALPGATTFRLR
jgi:hypothetical protein